MGIAELQSNQLVIHSHIITYGNAADFAVTENIRQEIESMWNAPLTQIVIRGSHYHVDFKITASCQPSISAIAIYENTDPRNNYFRIEEFVHGNISFVDGLGCNSGYFKLDNLFKNSTTAAHEYGHTLGLPHPATLDLRGKGIPGIMYPRGTLVDPAYQYNPSALPGDGANGGTINPIHRRVTQEDIDLLKIPRLRFENRRAIIGDFTSVWHPNHADINPSEYSPQSIAG